MERKTYLIIIGVIFVAIVIFIVLGMSKVNTTQYVEANVSEVLNVTTNVSGVANVTNISNDISWRKTVLYIVLLLAVVAVIWLIIKNWNNWFKRNANKDQPIRLVREAMTDFCINTYKVKAHSLDGENYITNDVIFLDEFCDLQGDTNYWCFEVKLLSGEFIGMHTFKCKINQELSEIRDGKFNKQFHSDIKSYKKPRGFHDFRNTNPMLEEIHAMSELPDEQREYAEKMMRKQEDEKKKEEPKKEGVKNEPDIV